MCIRIEPLVLRDLEIRLTWYDEHWHASILEILHYCY